MLTLFLGCVLCWGSAKAAVEEPVVGSVAPEFEAQNLLTGEKFPLSILRGKVVIVTFWATWCAPCRRELPILERAQRYLGKDKLIVLAVNYREESSALAAMKKSAPEWQLTFARDPYGSIARRYAITAIPHLFIIDKFGNIYANHVGYGDRSLDELVADLNGALLDRGPGDHDEAAKERETSLQGVGIRRLPVIAVTKTHNSR